jgi:hypothetical protein
MTVQADLERMLIASTVAFWGCGETAEFHPAAHPAPPLVTYHGGRPLHAPEIVTVTFRDDTRADEREAFDDALITSDYWRALTSEYCGVAPGKAGAHVRLTESSTSSDQDQIMVEDFLNRRVANGALPSPSTDTLYLFYYPSGAPLGGAFAAGFHGSLTLTDTVTGMVRTPSTTVTYAVAKDGVSAAAHEVIEAATDPSTDSPAWIIDDAAFADYFHGNEVADLCQFGGGPVALLPKLAGFEVPRSWSNAQALAGHDPCMPGLNGTVYFGAAPASQLVDLAVGESSTIDVTAFSDGRRSDWTLSVDNGRINLAGAPYLDVAVSPTRVNNGAHATVRVKLLQPFDPGTLVVSFALVSSADLEQRWPIAVKSH